MVDDKIRRKVGAIPRITRAKRIRKLGSYTRGKNSSSDEPLHQSDETTTDVGVLHFEVDATLLFQLGERLVARPSVALAELIKNGYDADATRVAVLFEGVTSPSGTIIVDDNGTGMTFEDIERAWMRIAGSEKVRNPISPRFCRSLTGAKGIGRFASRRLSRRMTLSTIAERPDGSKEKVLVNFDWEAFSAGRNISTIPVTYERRTVNSEAATGVTLYLEGIRDPWTQEEVTDLQQDLLSLTSPFPTNGVVAIVSKSGCQTDPGFSLEFHSDEFTSLSGRLDNLFLEAAWARLEGEVNDQGVPQYHLYIRGATTPITFVPDIQDQVSFRRITGTKMTVYFVVYKSTYFSNFNVRDASAYGRRYGGVRLYLDNFRVFPYGEPSDDWLELDKIRAARSTTMPFSWLSDLAQGLKRPLLLTPGNNQLFGAVHISQVRHPDLQLTINRERLLETEGFEELKHFVQTGLFWLTVEYARRQAEEKEEERERASKEESSVASTLDNLAKVIADSEGVSPEVKLELSRIVSKAKEAAERREEEVISEVSMLRVLASAGTTIIIFGHQLRALVDELGRIHADLTRLKSRLPDPVREDYDRILGELAEWRNTVEDQARQIGLLVGADARRRRRRLVVRDVVDKVIRPLSNYVKRYDIEVINAVANEVRTPPMFEAELHAIIINIFTNALKAVRSQPLSRIQVEATQAERGVYIRMLDTGVGVPVDKRTEVFRPFVTTSMPDPILGVGTGLGLAVVRDLLEIYGGTARFIDPPSPWHTAIEVFLPREV